MLTLRRHRSHDYAILPDIDDADAGIISVDDQVFLDKRLSAAGERRSGLAHRTRFALARIVARRPVKKRAQ
jgi:hypothetical protein